MWISMALNISMVRAGRGENLAQKCYEGCDELHRSIVGEFRQEGERGQYVFPLTQDFQMWLRFTFLLNLLG